MLDFRKLWRAYHALHATQGHAPCSGPYANQSALRMAIALEQCGYSFKTYTAPKCRHGHPRNAESLANWLSRKKLERPEIYSAKTDKDNAAKAAKQALQAKQGIIFFKDCFTTAGHTFRSGDHIDLWDKGKTIDYSDPTNCSEQVWFWEIAFST
jgi:hypothetical protein